MPSSILKVFHIYLQISANLLLEYFVYQMLIDSQQVISEPPKGLYTRLNKDQNLFIPPNQVVMSANDNFSLHDDEELSLHDDAIFE
ncbi:hypothetical protein Tco_1554877 [Tanacetum coccineum]